LSPSPVDPQIESTLLVVIAQLIAIIAAARLAGVVFRRLGQPVVCGEVAAGLLLGPSAFGKLFPGAFQAIFDPSVGQILSLLSQVGLILLMFLIGMEFDFGHVPANGRAVLSVSIAGIVAPFAAGFALGEFMHRRMGLNGSALSFSLFMATAMSITALPVLGRIMIELGLNRTRIGSLTISAAALEDAVGWILLALVTAITRSALEPPRLALMIVGVAAFSLAMVFAVRPLVARWTSSVLRAHGGDLTLNAQAILLVLVLLSAAATNLIGIFSLFGAFLFGAILHDQQQLGDAVHRRLHDFVAVFFLPIFFTYTGLRTDIGSMTGAAAWGFCGLVLAIAVIGKFGGCAAAARWSGLPARESAMIGVMMNTRGLMELVVVNVGYDLGVIPRDVFFMLVLMAVVTTYMTTPILRRLIPQSEAWESFRTSPFAVRRV
jgi:Kef-type K+ transport system membrane component KefB